MRDLINIVEGELLELFKQEAGGIHELTANEMHELPYFFSLNAAYRFVAHDRKFFVLFIEDNDYEGDFYQFSFAAESSRHRDGLTYEPTGKGGTGVEVYSKVATAIRMFMEKHNPDGLVFAGQTPRQHRLYEVLFSRIPLPPGFEFGRLDKYFYIAKSPPVGRTY